MCYFRGERSAIYHPYTFLVWTPKKKTACQLVMTTEQNDMPGNKHLFEKMYA